MACEAGGGQLHQGLEAAARLAAGQMLGEPRFRRRSPLAPFDGDLEFLAGHGYSCREAAKPSRLWLARLAGVEPAARGFEGRCSIQLSYRRAARNIAGNAPLTGVGAAI